MIINTVGQNDTSNFLKIKDLEEKRRGVHQAKEVITSLALEGEKRSGGLHRNVPLLYPLLTYNSFPRGVGLLRLLKMINEGP